MSYQMPDVFGQYRRKSDGLAVIVGGCTGSESFSEVTCRRADGSGHRWYVRLENFWKKYERAAS
ncbi:hypothetical protein [Paractinoplanes ferrugineus]|nr:hypothetical protein [Actinoplanes ferrugineus]